MQTFARTSMTSGVALIGASAIALSPIVVPPQQVHLPAIPVSSVAATLTASVDPISEWVQVLTTTFNNLSALGQQVLSSPAPILAQIIANQIGYATTISTGLANAGNSLVTALTALPQFFQTAAQQLAAGQISAGLNTAFQAVLALVQAPGFALLQSGILDIPGKVLQNVTNVVQLVPAVISVLGLSVVSAVNGVEHAFGDTAQAVFDGVRAGNFGAAVNALVNVPAVLTNAFLNGYAGSWGILTPVSAGLGFVPVLVAMRDGIAQALGAPAAAVASPHAAAALPTPVARLTSVSGLPTGTGNAITVALRTEPKVEDPVGETPATPVTPPAHSTPAVDEFAPAAGPEITGPAGSATGTSTTPSTGTRTDDAAGSESTGSGESTGSTSGKVVRDSLRVLPGKPGTKSGAAGDGLTKAADSLGKNLDASVSKIRDGIKKGFGKSVKSDKAGSDSVGSSAGASSGSGGSSSE